MNEILTDCVYICLVDCLSTFKNAVEMTEELPASLAVDGFYHTYSCTEPDVSHPWWAVDLGDAYLILSVTIYLPNVNHDNRNYRPPCFIHYYSKLIN